MEVGGAIDEGGAMTDVGGAMDMGMEDGGMDEGGIPSWTFISGACREGKNK